MTDFSHGVHIQQTQAQFGQKGHYWRVNGDGATTAGVVYYAIQAVENSVITYKDNKNSNIYSSKSIPAGLSIYGELVDITVVSGTVILYGGDFVNIWDETHVGALYSLGDSTVANFGAQINVFSYVTSDVEKIVLANSGDRISDQLTAWNNAGPNYDAGKVFIQIGHNDIAALTAVSSIIAALQNLVNKIATDQPSAEIYICTMTPARQRYINLLGEANGAVAYANWLAVNESIAGNGATPITNVTGRITSHTDTLNDGNGNLAAEYDIGDGIHPNEAARIVNANAYQQVV